MPRRKTKSQTTILNLLQQEPNALSHDGITAKLEEQMDRVTIYRILNRFVEDGLAHRIVADDGRQYFASCQANCSHDLEAHGHLHFRCVVCDQVECVDGEVDYRIPAGYQVDNSNIILSGSCRMCSEKR
jgi:Fur family ferric uptake transcriptional regulator